MVLNSPTEMDVLVAEAFDISYLSHDFDSGSDAAAIEGVLGITTYVYCSNSFLFAPDRSA